MTSLPHGYEIPFLMDTGTECNLLPVDVYKRVSGDQHLNSLYARGKSALILANGEERPTEGKATLFASRKGQKHQIEVNVVKGGGYEPILSKQIMLDMNLIQILDSDHLSVVKTDHDPLLEDAVVFEGLGKLAGRYKITIDESIKPVVQPPRRLPVAITEQAKKMKNEMTSDGIIEKVNQPTDSVSSMLVVSKPSVEADGETKISICLDPGNLNVAIKREHFPMSTIEEIAIRLNGAKLLSVFDASNDFWQLELDDESSLPTTFTTPSGVTDGSECLSELRVHLKCGSAEGEST